MERERGERKYFFFLQGTSKIKKVNMKNKVVVHLWRLLQACSFSEMSSLMSSLSSEPSFLWDEISPSTRASPPPCSTAVLLFSKWDPWFSGPMMVIMTTKAATTPRRMP